jgi:hypothetical protein
MSTIDVIVDPNPPVTQTNALVSSFIMGLNFPKNVKFNNGTLYIVDTNNSKILTATSSGAVSTLINNPLLRYPSDIAFDSDDNMYIANTNGHNILKYSNNVLSLFAGSPTNIGGAIQNGTGSNSVFKSPSGIVVHPNGNIIVVDSGNSCLRSITPAAVVSTLTAEITTGRFPRVSRVAVNSTGMLFVTRTGTHTILKVTPDGQSVTTYAGIVGENAFTDGIGSQARFHGPIGITIDQTDDNIYFGGLGWDLYENMFKIYYTTHRGFVSQIHFSFYGIIF